MSGLRQLPWDSAEATARRRQPRAHPNRRLIDITCFWRSEKTGSRDDTLSLRPPLHQKAGRSSSPGLTMLLSGLEPRKAAGLTGEVCPRGRGGQPDPDTRIQMGFEEGTGTNLQAGSQGKTASLGARSHPAGTQGRGGHTCRSRRLSRELPGWRGWGGRAGRRGGPGAGR